MADHNKPTLTSTYTNFVSELDTRMDDLALGLDPSTSTPTNLPTGAIRYTSASSKWEKWNGSSWGDLSSSYSINISGSAATLSATLPVNKGGSGATTLTGLIKGNGTSAFSNAVAGDVTTALGYIPVNKNGDTMTGSLRHSYSTYDHYNNSAENVKWAVGTFGPSSDNFVIYDQINSRIDLQLHATSGDLTLSGATYTAGVRVIQLAAAQSDIQFYTSNMLRGFVYAGAGGDGIGIACCDNSGAYQDTPIWVERPANSLMHLQRPTLVETANTPLAVSSTNSSVFKIDLKDNGTLRGVIGADASKCMRVFNNTLGETFSVDQSGNTYAAANINLTGSIIQNSTGLNYNYNASNHVATYKKAGTYNFYWRTSSTGLPGGTGEATLMELDNSGNLITLGNITAYSDETVKKNWKVLSSGFVYALSEVKSGTYSRTDTEEPVRQVGVSAQSLQKVMPEAVLENENGMLSVAYGNAALAACVEIAKEVVRLREEVELLKGSK